MVRWAEGKERAVSGKSSTRWKTNKYEAVFGFGAILVLSLNHWNSLLSHIISSSNGSFVSFS